ncbi:TetR/AcrR family transcriptional regulator [Actinomadura sp. HBU206391]|uniref:TetR/AcrR family transcriptional regulator n=1 Tax=Actinomadura sp. HBU206391 TaxID=2731692 RepID=UPI0021C840E5|nr:TetR/AcrR family transcriptional regulator [Actinomadura sp. HBU206391]
MTDSMRSDHGTVVMKRGKRERLTDAAVQMLHEQGVEKTTLADIARAAGIPVGNVYYYFKTKDDLVEAAIGAHAQRLRAMIASLDELPTPQDRLKTLIGGWVGQRDLAARFGCPFGTLSSELDKRADGLDRTAAEVMQGLIDWSEQQFRSMGRTDSRDLAVALIAAYQGISLLTNTFRDPELMTREGDRLERWIDSLGRP